MKKKFNAFSKLVLFKADPQISSKINNNKRLIYYNPNNIKEKKMSIVKIQICKLTNPNVLMVEYRTFSIIIVNLSKI